MNKNQWEKMIDELLICLYIWVYELWSWKYDHYLHSFFFDWLKGNVQRAPVNVESCIFYWPGLGSPVLRTNIPLLKYSPALFDILTVLSPIVSGARSSNKNKDTRWSVLGLNFDAGYLEGQLELEALNIWSKNKQTKNWLNLILRNL